MSKREIRVNKDEIKLVKKRKKGDIFSYKGKNYTMTNCFSCGPDGIIDTDHTTFIVTGAGARTVVMYPLGAG